MANEVFKLIYSEVDLEIDAVYDAGFEARLRPGIEKGGLRLLCPQPLWQSRVDHAVILNTGDTLVAPYFLERKDGIWKADASFDGPVYAIHKSKGRLYVGGDFGTIDGTTVNYVAYRDEDDIWHALGSGMNGIVRIIASDPAGNIYAGGDFTVAGGTTAYRIAKWDGSNWSALGNGFNSAVRGLLWGSDEKLYAVGDFLTDGTGSGSYNYVAVWDGTSWSALANGLNGPAYAIAESPDGSIYVGGEFTNASGISAPYIARWDGTAWGSLGSGLNGGVRALETDVFGNVYVGGRFTNAGGVEVNRSAIWDNNIWRPLGSIPSPMGNPGIDYVRGFAWDVDGSLWGVGNVDFILTTPIDEYIARYDGSDWISAGIEFPSSTFQCIHASGGDLYTGFAEEVTINIPDLTIVNVEGSAPTYPVIKVKRSGGNVARLKEIRNLDTKRSIYFDLNLLDGETIVVDTRERRRGIYSNTRGNVTDSILQGSELNWPLLPGENRIMLKIDRSGSPTLEAVMIWRERYWSVDDAI